MGSDSLPFTVQHKGRQFHSQARPRAVADEVPDGEDESHCTQSVGQPGGVASVDLPAAIERDARGYHHHDSSNWIHGDSLSLRRGIHSGFDLVAADSYRLYS